MTFRAKNSLMGRCVREIVLGPGAPGPPAYRGPRTNRGTQAQAQEK
jgi:hypothetical protein